MRALDLVVEAHVVGVHGEGAPVPGAVRGTGGVIRLAEHGRADVEAVAVLQELVQRARPVHRPRSRRLVRGVFRREPAARLRLRLQAELRAPVRRRVRVLVVDRLRGGVEEETGANARRHIGR